MDSVKNAGQQASSTVQSGAQQAGSTVQSGAQQAQSTTTGDQDWNAMTEEQKKAAFDSLPEEKKQGKTYVEWIKEGYQNQKENWMPWIEDMYLKWFTKDNKASYATKDTLNKSKVTGVEQVDNLQDGVNNLVAGQVGQGGLLQPAGDMISKEGVNRAERKGKDADGSYGGQYVPSAVSDPVVSGAQKGGEAAQGVGSYITGGAKSAGGYVGGMFGGGNKQEEQK